MRSVLSLLSLMLVLTGCADVSKPKPMSQSQPSEAMSVADFKALWQAANRQSNRTFPTFIQLAVSATIDHKVERITVTATPQSKKERFLMLDCWAQVITTMKRTVEGTHVANVFRAMGIDPNADLAGLTGATVTFDGDAYRSWNEDQTYTFTFEEGGV